MFSRLERDAKLLIVVSGTAAIGYFGIQMLLKVLYILRLGHGPEYVGAFKATVCNWDKTRFFRSGA